VFIEIITKSQDCSIETDKQGSWVRSRGPVWTLACQARFEGAT
jgi:hypothetical protein